MPPFNVPIKRSLLGRLQNAVQARLPLPGGVLMANALAQVGRYRRRRALKGTAEVKTIVVGSQTFGGSGKTPVCLYLAERLCARTKVGVLVRPTRKGQHYQGRITSLEQARAAGDEAVLLWQRLPASCDLFVMKDLGKGQLIASGYVQCLIVDDGLRRPDLGCDLSIVVVDNGVSDLVFPLGPCREDNGLLKSADIVWLNKVDEAPKRAPVDAKVRSRYVPVGLVNQMNQTQSLASLGTRPVSIVCGIGRPESFYQTLMPYVNEVVRVFEYGDHEHFHCPEPVRENELIITTEKDLARLQGVSEVWALRVDLVVEDWDGQLEQQLKELCA